MDKILLTESQIHDKIVKIADEISIVYHEDLDKLVLLIVLDGSMVFGVDLLKELGKKEIYPEIRTISVSSYEGQEHLGPRMNKEWGDSLENRDIIIIEDIVDTGDTINYIKRLLLDSPNQPSTIEVASLLVRNLCEEKPVFKGFVIDEGLWVYGYGMDTPQYKNRSLPNIYVKTQKDES